MARINPRKNPDPESVKLLSKVKESLGSTPNMFTTLAHSPAALRFYLDGLEALKGSKLSAALREQLSVAVAGANECDYCASAHTALGEKFKIPVDELALNLNAESTNRKVEAALAFARMVVETRGQVADDDLVAIKAAGYSEADIADLVAVVAINIFTNYFNRMAGTEVDFPLVPSSPLPEAA